MDQSETALLTAFVKRQRLVRIVQSKDQVLPALFEVENETFMKVAIA
jgi:hypothetical protein